MTEHAPMLEWMEFWKWFEMNANRFVDLVPKSAAWIELNDRIRLLSFDGWEVGPAEADKNFLAVSPNGIPDRLETARAFVDCAPAIAGWTFLAAKPPKKWQRKFQWSEAAQEIDAEQWKFCLYRYPDGMIDVVLLGPELSEFSRDDRLRILEFVVESELGEELTIETVCGVDLDEHPSDAVVVSSVPINDLRKVILDQRPA